MTPTLELAIRIKAKHLGFTLDCVTDEPQSSYTELCVGGVNDIEVWSGASDNTIYSDPITNWALRYWHDYTHIVHRKNFSLADELLVTNIQCNQLEYKLDRTILFADLALQRYNYESTQTHIENQKEWVTSKVLELLTPEETATLRMSCTTHILPVIEALI